MDHIDFETTRLQSTLDLQKVDFADFFKGLTRPCEMDEWRRVRRQRSSGIRRSALKRRLFAMAGKGLKRTEDYVRTYYARWARSQLREADPFNDPAFRPVTWRGEHISASPWATNRVSLLRLARLIEVARPAHVLEVGTGNGLYPLLLSCAFPDVKFCGIELTAEGVAAAADFQYLETLPEPLLRFLPLPVRDPTAFRRVVIEQGSARSLPYQDASFDLVFTCLALEQMEVIRKQALSEIARVAKRWASFIEPFGDVNTKGLQRAYIYGMNYFRGRSSDLPRYGLRPLLLSSDFPQVFYMNIAHVVAVRTQ